MTEVFAQTAPQANAGAVPPAEQAPPTATAAPAGDITTQPPNNPSATTETRPGAGGGVDLNSMDVVGLQQLIAAMPGDEEDELEPVAQPVPATPATPAAQPSAPPAQAVPVDDDDRMLPPGQAPNNVKIPVKDDDLARQTAWLYKENRLKGGSMTLGEAEKLAKQVLGMPVETPSAPTASSADSPEVVAPLATTAPSTPGQKSSTQLQEELQALEAQFEEAGTLFDNVGQAKALRDINRVNREITEALLRESQMEQQASVQQAEAQQVFLQQWEAGRDRAYAQFAHADAANPASALHRRAVELQQAAEMSQDAGQQAIANSAQSALWFFTQAALEMGITAQSAAPAPAAAPAAIQPNQNKSTPPSAPPPQTPVGAHLLSGSPSGSTRPAANAGLALVDSITNAHDLERLIHALPSA